MFIVCHLPRYSLFSKQQFSCSLFVIYPGIHCSLSNRSHVHCLSSTQVLIVLLATVLMFIVCHLPKYSLFSEQAFSCSLFVIYPGIHCSLINRSHVHCLSSTQLFIVLLAFKRAIKCWNPITGSRSKYRYSLL